MVCKCTSHGSDATCAVVLPTRLVHVAIAVSSVPLSTSPGSVMLGEGATGVLIPVATTCPAVSCTLNAHDSTPDSESVNPWHVLPLLSGASTSRGSPTGDSRSPSTIKSCNMSFTTPECGSMTPAQDVHGAELKNGSPPPLVTVPALGGVLS
eukprot:scaffold9160_cov73-Phaeocystis_antarctica.AAC.5